METSSGRQGNALEALIESVWSIWLSLPFRPAKRLLRWTPASGATRNAGGTKWRRSWRIAGAAGPNGLALRFRSAKAVASMVPRL